MTNTKFTQKTAQSLGFDILIWLANKPDLLDVFVNSTGAGQDDMYEQVQNPAFLISLIDFLCLDDAWVIEFCDSAHYNYTDPMHARAALPGGRYHQWT